jgi:SAM-dependent methyltransferase
MAAQPLDADVIRDANTRYHDDAAAHYDAKWGIDYGDIGQTQVVGKVAKALGGDIPTFARSLEIGAGTGYFSLNLLQAGIVREAVATDISPGMLDTLQSNARRLGLPVETVDSFDLVFGHAVLHHLPDLDQAFREFRRVLRPGGTFLFAGEPSRIGDRLASVPKRTAFAVAPLWRRLMGAAAADDPGQHGAADAELGELVDVHAFVPDELARHARNAGLEDVKVRGEELLANWFGWANRTLESTAEPDDVPMAWRQYAYHGYLFFQGVDQRLLEERLPAAIFYNLMVSGRSPRA